MGKPKHYRPPGKKKEGNAARYVTRSQAIKILQVSLSDFRKLCIHKGVFPREPKKKVKGNHHTYYHLKDVMYILHDPLLEKFREIRAYQRKIKKAKAKTNDELAKLLLSRAPSYRLDMVIRDRVIENEYLGLRNGILDQSAILLSSHGCLTCMNCKILKVL
ncbi:hypothetical protein V6Z11_D06G214400 [Gossypium hirsutum]|uniref:Pescadillo homolog n=1 Tax=Gossypium hirsutum TaxID=3635 RepID=A0A1U8L5I9_GOSHI|nr:pescadillo homolog [Gossypium hirsutum]